MLHLNQFTYSAHSKGHISVDGRLFPQEIVLCVGPSGSGKTSFLRALSGLEKQLSGDFILDNHSLVNKKPHQRLISFLFQESFFFEHLNVQQNLDLIKKWMPATAQTDFYQHYLALIDCLDIKPLLHKEIPSLSGGEKQRLLISRCFLVPAKIYLLDEPLTALDGKLKNNFLKWLQTFQKNTTCYFFISTHEKELFEKTLSMLKTLEWNGSSLLTCS